MGTPDFIQRFVDVLLSVPGMESFETRSTLLTGIPSNVRAGLTRSQGSAYTDLVTMLDQLERLGRLTSGERPLAIVARNAQRPARGTDVEAALNAILKELEQRYSGLAAPVPSDPEAVSASPATPEVIIGRDERVRPIFLENAIRTGRSVALLRVPRIFDGAHKPKDDAFGTGWLIAPGLLITNHHVIEARDRKFEAPAKPNDFTAQATGTVAWFDYHQEGGTHQDASITSLVASDEALDYALLRLSPDSAAT
ncbi:MAG TPA: serine protease, partial [Chloroflexia bacterium]|nr:serine protease [Chloroflexia bacterium]